MKVWLRTRGNTRDYAFLGEAPPDRWWAPYKDATSFEQPSLILERVSPDQWRCFISAIPSTRRDRVNTRIRYSLALSGSATDDQETLRKLLGHVLNIFQFNPPSENNPLTELLDGAVGDKADEWLGGAPELAQRCIVELGLKLNRLVPRAIEPQQLAKELENLLTGVTGRAQLAVMLNFIGSRKNLSEVDPQSKLSAAGGEVLILPSPVAGGKISGFFTLSPQTARPGAEGFGTTGHSPCGDDGDAFKRKAGLGAKTVAALVLICVVLTIVSVYYAWTAGSATSH